MNRSYVATTLAVVVLSGRVLDRTTGQGLPHVAVRAAGGSSTTTDATGRYALRGVKAGTIEVTVTSDDVPSQRFSIRLGPAVTHHDFRACSTTLDYNCGTPALHDPGEGSSAG